MHDYCTINATNSELVNFTDIARFAAAAFALFELFQIRMVFKHSVSVRMISWQQCKGGVV